MYYLDLRGLINPFDLLKVSKAFKELEAGETIEIIGSSPETATGILKVLPALSCEMISREIIGDEHKGFRILLKKKKADHRGYSARPVVEE